MDNCSYRLTRLGGFLWWMLTRKPAKWPKQIANVSFAPPKRAGAQEIAVTFIGHATFLVQVGGVSILTDPIWSRRASPFSFVGPRRVGEPGQPLDAIPAVDLLLVSHNHYDHLDLPTLRAVQSRWSPVAVTGIGNGRHLAKANIRDVIELDWWEETSVRGANITFVPAKHGSARTFFDRNRALWGGFVVEANGLTMYFAGDTGYNCHFREIRRCFPPIDLALLPIGTYEPRWFMSANHMNPEEAVRSHIDLGANRSIGMHHATFQLSDEAIDAPARALAAARARFAVGQDRFSTLQCGETMVLQRQHALTKVEEDLRMTSGDLSERKRDARARSKEQRAALSIGGTDKAVTPAARTEGGETGLRIEHLPRDVGRLLVYAGVLGVIVPGVPGVPFLVGGVAILYPGGPKLLSTWLPSRLVRASRKLVGRFADDLDRRYPLPPETRS